MKNHICGLAAHCQTGGFYWAGACVPNSVLLVGTDDGQNSTSPVLSTGRVLLFDAATGTLLDEVGGIRGDVRSTICYDSGSNAYYATSKGRGFIGSSWTRQGGRLTRSRRSSCKTATGVAIRHLDARRSTRGGPHVGVSGSVNLMHIPAITFITVIDLDGAMSIAYRVPTRRLSAGVRSAHNGV